MSRDWRTSNEYCGGEVSLRRTEREREREEEEEDFGIKRVVVAIHQSSFSKAVRSRRSKEKRIFVPEEKSESSQFDSSFLRFIRGWNLFSWSNYAKTHFILIQSKRRITQTYREKHFFLRAETRVALFVHKRSDCEQTVGRSLSNDSQRYRSFSSTNRKTLMHLHDLRQAPLPSRNHREREHLSSKSDESYRSAFIPVSHYTDQSCCWE